MNLNDTLYISQAEISNVYYNGQPIWICPEKNTLEKIKKTANIFGANCQFIPAEKIENFTNAPQKGRVVVLDEALTEHGKLYAHLTHRHFQKINIEEIPEIKDIEIVVSLIDDLNAHLMDHLYESNFDQSFAPGIICADTLEKLWDKVFIKAIAFHFPVRSKKDWLHYYPTLPLESQHHEKNAVTTFGGNISDQYLKEKMNGHSDFLLVAKSHADGMDAVFNPLIMCSLERSLGLYKKNANGKMPACLTNDFCHRLGQPLSKALASGKLFSPSQINTKLMVFNTCTGMLIDSPTINFKWGFSAELLDNPDIQVLVTSWQIITTDLEKLEALSGALRSGVPLGRALARYNQEKKTDPVCLSNFWGTSPAV